MSRFWMVIFGITVLVAINIAETVTFNPTADGYMYQTVFEGSITCSNIDDDELKIGRNNGDSIDDTMFYYYALLCFTGIEFSGEIDSAVLRLYVINFEDIHEMTGISVNGWFDEPFEEDPLPTCDWVEFHGSVDTFGYGYSGDLIEGTWINIDITDYVIDHITEGFIAIHLIPTGTDGIATFCDREGSHQPELVIYGEPELRLTLDTAYISDPCYLGQSNRLTIELETPSTFSGNVNFQFREISDSLVGGTILWIDTTIYISFIGDTTIYFYTPVTSACDLSDIGPGWIPPGEYTGVVTVSDADAGLLVGNKSFDINLWFSGENWLDMVMAIALASLAANGAVEELKNIGDATSYLNMLEAISDGDTARVGLELGSFLLDKFAGGAIGFLQAMWEGGCSIAMLIVYLGQSIWDIFWGAMYSILDTETRLYIISGNSLPQIYDPTTNEIICGWIPTPYDEVDSINTSNGFVVSEFQFDGEKYFNIIGPDTLPCRFLFRADTTELKIWDATTILHNFGWLLVKTESKSTLIEDTIHTNCDTVWVFSMTETLTLCEDDGIELFRLPINTEIANISPNPFNASISISYDIAKASNVSIEIYDITGHSIATLVNEKKSAGTYTSIWTAPNDIPSGIYFVRMKTGDNTITKRAILIR